MRELPRFAKAVALALALAGRGAGMNLRRGPLAYERGFAWVREKIPVLAGLAAVILVSFVFSAWARLYAVHKERDALESALGAVTKEVLGTEATTAAGRAGAAREGDRAERRGPDAPRRRVRRDGPALARPSRRR